MSRHRASCTFVLPLALSALAVAPSMGSPSRIQIQQASGYCVNAERALRTGNFRKARQSLEQALAIIPAFPAAHMGMGHIALSEKRYADALHEYQLARSEFSDLAQMVLMLRTADYGDARSEIVALQDELRLEEHIGAPR